MTTAEAHKQKGLPSLSERGMEEGSYFRVFFKDGSSLTEHECNWSSISEQRTVRYLHSLKVFNVCNLPIVRIEVVHAGISDGIDVPEDCVAYQAIRGETTLSPHFKRVRTIGRVLGLIRGDMVVEERFLDGLQLKVSGFRS